MSDFTVKVKSVLAATVLSCTLSAHAQLVSGSIVYPFNFSPTPTNPIPFVATASDLAGVNWTVSFNIGPAALGRSNTVAPVPLLGVNTITFEITPVCPICILEGIIFDFGATPAFPPGDWLFQVFSGTSPISPITSGTFPFGPAPVNASIVPQTLTGPTQISIAFMHTNPVTASFLIDNLQLNFLYDASCVPEPGAGHAVLAVLGLGSAFLIWRRRRKAVGGCPVESVG